MPRVKHIVDGAGNHYGYRFECPGCKEAHVIPTKPHERGWDFNGSETLPTFSPSILVYDHDVWINGTKGRSFRCHSHVTDGRIAFLVDSTHLLAGQTVDLPEVPS